MSPDSAHDADRLEMRVRNGVAAISNPASLKGLIAALGGTAVLLLPGLATAVVALALGASIAASGILDLMSVFTGKHRLRKRNNRVWAFIRGIVSLAFCAFTLYLAIVTAQGAEIGLELLVAIAGMYVMFRGAFYGVASAVRRNVTHRLLRVTGAITATAFGAIAFAAPGTVSSSVISGLAVLAIVLGLVLVTWGLRRTEGAIPTQADPYTNTLPEILWDSIKNSDIGRERREELAQGLYYESPARLAKRTAWWVMLVLSVAIATFAVLADSTAVVIGAMLVAPLMVPILGLAGAIINGWRRRAIDSLILVTLGVLASITLSYGLAAWAPVAVAFDTNSQIVSRVDPSMVDMLIAIAAGAAGAFATVDKRVSASIAGVAIAVALVPPLSVVGVTLGAGRFEDAAGAMLLFLTNFVAIVLSACAVFVLTGFARPAVLQSRASGILTTVIPFVALAALVLVPLMFTSQGLLATAAVQNQAREVVEGWLGEDSALEIQDIRVDSDGVTVALAGPGQPPSAVLLQKDFADVLPTTVAITIEHTPVEVTSVEAPRN
ncbi:DUF389 domain-containing protein [Demequina flava]|uniref:DUF389 domain-containing protein n=1 Tax=Demequina flava TaxID=1095025 RepID=UPI00078308B2|nr:DUF389 domain-containing protein [Demequina flava]